MIIPVDPASQWLDWIVGDELVITHEFQNTYGITETATVRVKYDHLYGDKPYELSGGFPIETPFTNTQTPSRPYLVVKILSIIC